MHSASPRARSRAPTLITLLALAVVVACDSDRVAAPRVQTPGAASADLGWSSLPCQIGKVPPPTSPEWNGYAFPVSDTSCAVTWTATTPSFGGNPAYEWNMFFPHAPDVGSTRSTRWWIGPHNDIANGPLTFTFSGDVKAFAMNLTGIDMAGHYMVAYNAAGVEIGRANFVNDPIDHADAQQIVVAGIQKVVYYFPLGACAPSGCAQLDPVEHEAVYDADVIPRQQLCRIRVPAADSVRAEVFNSPVVRRALEDALGRSDTTAAFKDRHEVAVLVFRNPDGTFRTTFPAVTVVSQCTSTFQVPLNDPTLVAVAHTHPFHEGDVPGCPGKELAKHEPRKNGGGSTGDFEQKNFNNVIRKLNQLPDENLLPMIVIDLDSAWYMPWDSWPGSGANKDTSRRSGFSGGGCRWI